ncbi:MAG: hypothetical protein ACFBZ8_08435 [Opitutales bacterium]
MQSPLYIQLSIGTWIINRKPAGDITPAEEAILRDTLACNPGDISVNIRGRVFELLRINSDAEAPADAPKASAQKEGENPARGFCKVEPEALPAAQDVSAIPFELEIAKTRAATEALLDRVTEALKQEATEGAVNPVLAKKRRMVLQSLILDLRSTIEALEAYLGGPDWLK